MPGNTHNPSAKSRMYFAVIPNGCMVIQSSVSNQIWHWHSDLGSAAALIALCPSPDAAFEKADKIALNDSKFWSRPCLRSFDGDKCNGRPVYIQISLCLHSLRAFFQDLGLVIDLTQEIAISPRTSSHLMGVSDSSISLLCLLD